MRSLIAHRFVSKNKSKLTNLMKISRIEGETIFFKDTSKFQKNLHEIRIWRGCFTEV